MQASVAGLSVNMASSRKQILYSSGRGGAGNIKKHTVPVPPLPLASWTHDDNSSIHSAGLSLSSASSFSTPSLSPALADIATRRHFSTNEDVAVPTNGRELDPSKMHALSSPKLSGRTGRGGAGYFKYLSGKDSPFTDAHLYPQTAALMAEHEQRMALMEKDVLERSRQRRSQVRSSGRGGSGNISIAKASASKQVNAKGKAKASSLKGESGVGVSTGDGDGHPWQEFEDVDLNSCLNLDLDAIRLKEFGVQEGPSGAKSVLLSSRRKARLFSSARASTSDAAHLRLSGFRHSQASVSGSSQARSSIFRVTRPSKRDSLSSAKSNISVYTRSSTYSSRVHPQHRESFVNHDDQAGDGFTRMPPSPISPHTPPHTPLPPLPPHAHLRGRGELRRSVSASSTFPDIQVPTQTHTGTHIGVNTHMHTRGPSSQKTKPTRSRSRSRSRSRLRTFFSRMRRPRVPRSQPLPPPPPVPMIRLASSTNNLTIGNAPLDFFAPWQADDEI